MMTYNVLEPVIIALSKAGVEITEDGVRFKKPRRP
jgi:hypothetical protein